MELLWKRESKILQTCINYRGKKKECNHFPTVACNQSPFKV